MPRPIDLQEEENMRRDHDMKTSKVDAQASSGSEDRREHTDGPKAGDTVPSMDSGSATNTAETFPELEAAEAPVPQADYERLQNERDQLLDRLARLQAEFDNYRKRESRERTEYRDYALSNAVEQFLPVLDNFQLALRSQGSLEQLRSGVDLIVRQMEEIVRSLGIQPVATAGARFDPRVHEAIEMVQRDDLPDQQVIEEVRRGYSLRERLLRPALVRVASNPKQKSA